LYVTSADSASVMRVVALSSLFEMSCDELYGALAACAHADPSSANRPALGMAGYNQALRRLLPGVAELRDPNALRFLTTALANVFFAFVPVGGDAAPLDELATGLSLFVQGSKSAKLQHAFALFDRDRDELLAPEDLQRFLSAVLSVLFATARQTAKLPPDQSRALCGVATDALARRIADEFGGRADGLVSFEDFGAWYNAEGCDVAPWLELLDLKKWQFSKTAGGDAAATAAARRADEAAAAVETAEARVATARTAAAAAAYGWALDAEDDNSDDDDSDDDDSEEADDDDDDDDDEDDDEQDEDKEEEEEENSTEDEGPTSRAALYGMGQSSARFSFALMDAVGEPSKLTLRLSDADVAALKRLVTTTGLSARPASAVCSPLLDAARDGLLAKKAFDGVVRALVPSESLSAEDRSKFSVLLSAIFYHFEATSESTANGRSKGSNGAAANVEDSANALELAIGMSLLCAGDKSSKLNYAWRVIDLDDDGLLNRAELLFFLRAFVRMLLALSFEASELGPAAARQAATNMASWLSGTVVARYGDATGRVSFDAFAQWYHDGFHQVAPWLELLDLKKWVL
jgi:Ca2+-binding EF-hand superfamily protein